MIVSSDQERTDLLTDHIEMSTEQLVKGTSENWVVPFVIKYTGTQVPVEKTIDIQVGEKIELVLYNSSCKKEFGVGEEFTAESLVVKLKAGGIYETIPDGGYTLDLSGILSTPGKRTVTVTFSSADPSPVNIITLTASYEINVLENVPSYLEIDTYKDTYTYGEPFDLSSVTATVTYTDGNTKEVTSGFAYIGPEKMESGEIGVSYTENGRTVDCRRYVTINPALELKVIPDDCKTVYILGEEFD